MPRARRTMKGRQDPPTYTLQSPPKPREREEPQSPWPAREIPYHNSWDTPRPRITSLNELLGDPKDVYYLPEWQRGTVWTPEQEVAFCERIWHGYAMLPMLFWRIGRPGQERIVVLDGQQRLKAMGATVYRADGTMNAGTNAFLDLETGTWKTEPTGIRPTTMADVMRWMSAFDLHQDRTPEIHRHMDLLIAAYDRLQHMDTCQYMMGPTVTREEAIRYFRAWNHPGTPMSPDEVEALINAAQECGG